MQRFFLSFLAIILLTPVYAQRPQRMDSILHAKAGYIETVLFLRMNFSESVLEKIVPGENDEKVKTQLYNALCWSYFNSDPQKALGYAKSQMALAEKLNYKDAIETSYDNFGFLYKNLGEYEQSIAYQIKSLKIKEEKKDSSGISVCMNGIGSLYFTMENYPKALEYFLKGTHMDSLMRDTNNLISNYGNIGACYDGMKDTSGALEYYLLAEKVSKDTKRPLSSDLLQNLGTVYMKKGDREKANEYLLHSLEIAKKEQDIRTIVVVTIALGDLNIQKKEYKVAIAYEEEALALCRSNKLIDFEIQTLRSLAEAYSRQGNHAKAFEYQKMFSELKDTLLNEKNSRVIAEMNTKYETEKKEKQIEIQNLTLTQQNLELNKRQIIIYTSTAGVVLLLLLSLFIYKGYHDKKTANTLLSMKNRIIEEQHKDITDSIKYAQRIQQAILPPDQMWFDLLPDSFVLYKPKDILSGDFYWIERSGDSVLVAAADCTGHGVPGALMSIVNFNLLNKAVLEQNMQKPAQILDEVNKWLTVSLHQTYNESTVRDGMDIALCSISWKKEVLQFAGAFNGGYIFKKNGTLIDLNGDKKPVGAFIEEQVQPFTNQIFNIEKGDRIYIFSDGYADQFGGPKGKKLKYNRLKQLITESLSYDMQAQKAYLDAKFDEWKSSYEQVDDVLVIGITI
jgi:serine phosphatase RsbU (regulator of sigma subunit)